MDIAGRPDRAEMLVWEPGDTAMLTVTIYDFPAGDMTNVRVAMRGFSQRFYVPTESLKKPIEITPPLLV